MLTQYNPTTWQANNPFREPTWRWARARHLVDSREPPAVDIDDPGIVHAMQFLTDCVENAGRRSRKLPSETHRAIGHARDIHLSKHQIHTDRLKAWLLTPASLDRVAAECSLPLPVVTAFAELFFDVRPRLGASDWIRVHAIGCGPGNNFAGASLGEIWKFFGYVGGELALKLVIAATTDSPLPREMQASFTNPTIDERIVRTEIKLLIAALTAETEIQHQTVAEFRRRLRRLDKRPTTRGAVSPMLELQAEFLSRVGRKPRRSSKKVAASAKPAMLTPLETIRAMQRTKPIAAATSAWR